ncbi:ubiquinone biosynthesis hydrox [Neoconidiobolus thromboides FSU 785]|nr:ubiquinone biosynthesis hydrox [Neoconidiobolus thromboides FSU 785]
MNNDEKDVVIVGGGAAGLALACAHDLLTKGPLSYTPKLALVEKFKLPKVRDPSAEPLPFSNRVVSLTPSSKQFLESIDVWEKIDLSRVRPYKNIKVWDAIGKGELEFETDQDSTMAYMIELNNLTSALMSKINEAIESGINIELLEGCNLDEIQKADLNENLDWPKLSLQNGTRNIRSRLLVGADGANSKVRLFADIESFGWDYSQRGVVATVVFDPPLKEEDPFVGYQRFLPTGPIALLPLDKQHSNLVWSMTPKMAENIKLLSSNMVSKLIKAAFSAEEGDLQYIINQLENGTIEVCDLELDWRPKFTSPASSNSFPSISNIVDNTVASFPLKLRHVSRYVIPRITLIGDAAHSMHPLAGQGLNLGLGDVESLTKQLTRGWRGGVDLGDANLLQGYPSERYFHNSAMLGATDKLYRLFRATDPVTTTIRSFGFNLINYGLPNFVKQAIVKAASGTGV